MIRSKNPFARFFGVIVQGRTYLNLLYLLLMLPLGIIYFLFFAASLTIGIPLAFLLVGFIILAILAVGWWAIASFERYLAIWLLRVDVPPMEKPGPKRQGTFGAFADWITNPVTWKSLLFILLKLPLGIFTFIVLVTLATTSIGLAISPLIYWWAPVELSLSSTISGNIDTLLEAVIACISGILLGFASLHIFNYLAYADALWAKMMLGNSQPVPGEMRPELPLQPVAPVVAAETMREQPLAPPFYEPVPEDEFEVTPPHGTAVADLGVEGTTPPEPSSEAGRHEAQPKDESATSEGEERGAGS